MATRDCWRCGVRTHMSNYGTGFYIPRPPGNTVEVWNAFKCDNCSALSVASGHAIGGNSAATRSPGEWLYEQPNVEWYPIRAIGKDFFDVPQHIAEAASEAYKCKSISAYRAAVQLARSVVEAVAKEKGITQGNIFSKINELYNRKFIREHIKDGAHEVRHFGNDMAHGDFVSPVTIEEAELVLILMGEILEEVYQSPARVAKAQAARAARLAQLNESKSVAP